jgi:hypothetical protein
VASSQWMSLTLVCSGSPVINKVVDPYRDTTQSTYTFPMGCYVSTSAPTTAPTMLNCM